MKVKEFTNTSNFAKAPFKTSTIAQLLTVGGLAIGVAASIPAAPAQAISLNSVQLAFQDGTANFRQDVNPTLNGTTDTFSVIFNPSSLAFVTAASGNLGVAPLFSNAQPSTYGVAPSTATFRQIAGGGANSFQYQLTSGNLNFNFNNQATLSVANGSTFGGSFTNNTGGVDFGILSSVGSFLRYNGEPAVALQDLAFSFNDSIGTVGGGYTVGALTVPAAQVPEPFTIIGTIVGGAAAMRMRKKLSDSTKN